MEAEAHVFRSSTACSRHLTADKGAACDRMTGCCQRVVCFEAPQTIISRTTPLRQPIHAYKTTSPKSPTQQPSSARIQHAPARLVSLACPIRVELQLRQANQQIGALIGTDPCGGRPAQLSCRCTSLSALTARMRRQAERPKAKKCERKKKRTVLFLCLSCRR